MVNLLTETGKVTERIAGIEREREREREEKRWKGEIKTRKRRLFVSSRISSELQRRVKSIRCIKERNKEKTRTS
jgi:hypothetical protein